MFYINTLVKKEKGWEIRVASVLYGRGHFCDEKLPSAHDYAQVFSAQILLGANSSHNQKPWMQHSEHENCLIGAEWVRFEGTINRIGLASMNNSRNRIPWIMPHRHDWTTAGHGCLLHSSIQIPSEIKIEWMGSAGEHTFTPSGNKGSQILGWLSLGI